MPDGTSQLQRSAEAAAIVLGCQVGRIDDRRVRSMRATKPDAAAAGRMGYTE